MRRNEGSYQGARRFQFPWREEVPDTRLRGHHARGRGRYRTAYSSLKNSGAITAQDADEAAFREKLGLPELDEAGIREEEPEPKETFSDHRHSVKKNFAEKRIDRELTFAEKKVDFAKLESKMDELEADLDKQTKALLHEARDKYMAALTRAAHAGDTQAIKDATLKVQAEYARVLKNASRGAFEYGKTNAAKEIKKDAPGNPSAILRQIDIQSDAIADAHIAEIVADAKNAMVNALSRGQSLSAALAAADLAAGEAIDLLARNTSNILTAGYINKGRDEVFDRLADDIHALQRSELLDAVTCNFCLSIDGRIVENDDSIARTGPVHSSCRGIWVAIMKDEAELPAISGIPKAIRDRLGDEVNDFDQLARPITKKGSAARKEADKRPE